MYPVSVEREYRLVFRNGLVEALLRAKHLGFGIMRKRCAGEGRQGAIGERLRPSEVGSRRIAHLIEHARCQLPGQKALYLSEPGSSANARSYSAICSA